MNNIEIDVVSTLPAPKRYSYFIKKVVDYEVVWGLFDEGWALSEDDQKNKLFPVWPIKEFAQLCAIEEWRNYTAEAIDLYEFIKEWLPGMEKDGIKPSIFFNNDDSVVVNFDTLLNDLEMELTRY